MQNKYKIKNQKKSRTKVRQVMKVPSRAKPSEGNTQENAMGGDKFLRPLNIALFFITIQLTL